MEAVMMGVVCLPRRSLRQLLAAVGGLFLAQPREAAPARSREALARQAERLLEDHGDRILRLAYSYLHNTGDAEAVL